MNTDSNLFPTQEHLADTKPAMQANKQEGIQQTAHQTETKTDTHQQMTVTLSMSFLHDIFKHEKDNGKDKKLTKAQALYDLLAKQQYAELMDDTSSIERNVKQLATEWHWSRQTVRQFINMLTEYNVARTYSVKGNTVILLNNINGLPDTISRRLKLDKASLLLDSSRQDAKIIPPWHRQPLVVTMQPSPSLGSMGGRLGNVLPRACAIPVCNRYKA